MFPSVITFLVPLTRQKQKKHRDMAQMSVEMFIIELYQVREMVVAS